MTFKHLGDIKGQGTEPAGGSSFYLKIINHKPLLMVIQVVTFSSPNVGGHPQPFSKGSLNLTIPKRSRKSRIARKNCHPSIPIAIFWKSRISSFQWWASLIFKPTEWNPRDETNRLRFLECFFPGAAQIAGAQNGEKNREEKCLGQERVSTIGLLVVWDSRDTPQ